MKEKGISETFKWVAREENCDQNQHITAQLATDDTYQGDQRLGEHLINIFHWRYL